MYINDPRIRFSLSRRVLRDITINAWLYSTCIFGDIISSTYLFWPSAYRHLLLSHTLCNSTHSLYQSQSSRYRSTMQLPTVLSLVLAAAPATLLASPMHQSQQSEGQASVAGQQQSSQPSEEPHVSNYVVVDEGHSVTAENQRKQALQNGKGRVGRIPTILGMSRVKANVNQTQMVGDSSSSSSDTSSVQSGNSKSISKRHHMDLGAYFAHRKHPDCAEQESKCKNCGE